jgi:P-type Cu2+ transporter
MSARGITINGDKSTTHASTMWTSQEASQKNGSNSIGGDVFHAQSMHTNGVQCNQERDNQAIENKNLCKHCHLPLNSKVEKESGFCCIGCQTVHDLIESLGLSHFYDLRAKDNNWLTKPVSLAKSKFAFFDDLLFQQEYVTQESHQCSKIVFQISGIHCTACVWLLEKLPQVLNGVISARVDLVKGKVIVRYDHNLTQCSKIGATIAALGYEPHPISISGIISKDRAHNNLLLIRLGVAAFSAMNVMLLFFARHQGYLTGIEQGYAQYISWASLLLSLPAVFFSAWPFFASSLTGIRLRKLHIDLPISVAIIAGFFASAINTILGRSEIYYDTVTALVFLLLLGRWFQQLALKRVGDTSSLMSSLVPLSVLRRNDDGKNEEVYLKSLRINDKVIVNNTEKIPCDGVVVEGSSYVNNSILTGESELLPIKQGSYVFAGTTNVGSAIVMQIETNSENSRMGKLISEIQTAPVRESKTSRFVDSVSFYFIVVVFVLSVITFLLWINLGFWLAWDRVISLLVVSCPCALGIATPITLSLAGARAAKKGILIKNGESLERLAAVTKVIFDKTGTLTYGEYVIVDSCLLDDSLTWPEVWGIIKSLEDKVEHPVAKALLDQSLKVTCIESLLEKRNIVPGYGIEGWSESGKCYLLGSLSWLNKHNKFFSRNAQEFLKVNAKQNNTIVGLAVGEKVVAIISLNDVLRHEAVAVVAQLRQKNIDSMVLSGDSLDVVERVAKQLSIDKDKYIACANPEMKAQLVEQSGETVVFVGDGVNDGLALSKASVGIGIKGGAEICLAVSDVYLIRPDLNLIVQSIDGAKKTLRQIYRHLGISVFYNMVAVSLAISGLIEPLMAAFVMPLSSLSVILSSTVNAPFKEDI